MSKLLADVMGGPKDGGTLTVPPKKVRNRGIIRVVHNNDLNPFEDNSTHALYYWCPGCIRYYYIRTIRVSCKEELLHILSEISRKGDYNHD